MTSPLLTYANALLLITTEEAPGVINGRVVSNAGPRYVVQCYLKRQDSKGTTTGADYPGQSIMPGVSGDTYLYRGYALRYGQAPTGYKLQDGEPTIEWITITSDTKPAWLTEGVICDHAQGNEQSKHCAIERITGRYGGTKIDELISNQIKGIPITIRSGDVIN